MQATEIAPLRRWFGTITAVRYDLLSDAARAKVAKQPFVPRYTLADELEPGAWKQEWEGAVARGKAIEDVIIARRTEELAEGLLPKHGGQLVRDLREGASNLAAGVSATIGIDAKGKVAETGKAAIGAGLSTPLTKVGVLSDVGFSAATNVGEAFLRRGEKQSTNDHIDTATTVAYDVASSTAAGVVGTVIGVAATPPVGIAAAVATKIGIDAVRDPIIWRVDALVAGVRATFSRR